MSECGIKTTCPYCGVGCGVVATAGADGTVSVRGDRDHPANFGRLCSKGTALGETLALDDRLLAPSINGEAASWDEALDRVATTFADTIAAHGPDSVAFYVSGQILTEDYYVANKLMKGFIGSANIDTNSRLCMASAVAGHRRAFGTDTVPGCYEDLEDADLVVLVGSNLAWCHPVLYQRLEAAKVKRGTRVALADPRATATNAIADMHLPLAPQSDVALFNGLLAQLAETGSIDRPYIDAHTRGFADALAAAKVLTPARVAKATGLSRAKLDAFYALFAATPKVVTVFSQGINQSTAGTDAVNAIINCHLATGRIGKPGMGPFSVTGQPNAMGGREVGGLANMLAAHMTLEDAGHRDLVQRFWRSPHIAAKPGLKAVDLFDAVDDGRIKALWIMATNPVDSMPDADRVKRALRRCPFVVVSDVTAATDTAECAHVLLPSLAWGEKSGTVTNSERRISRQRAFLPPPGQARADWWQFAEVGRRMGFAAAFAYAGEHEIFDEHARLSACDNDGTRDFDIGGVAGLDRRSFDAMAPLQWPRPAESGSVARVFANGGFFTPDRRARFVAVQQAPRAVMRQCAPLAMNTGRVRDHWHTMTRTSKTARLMGHITEPFVSVHPGDAAECGVADGELAAVSNVRGRVVARVRIEAGQRRGSVFVPIHWTDQFASEGRPGTLVAPVVDPISGQPGLKQSHVVLAPFAAARHGLLLLRTRPAALPFGYWAAARMEGGWLVEVATTNGDKDAAETLRDLGICGDLVTYRDSARSTTRAAYFDGDRLLGALFLAKAPLTLSRGFIGGLLATTHTNRAAVLAGRGGGTVQDNGVIVCACFEVGRKTIEAARTDGCATVDAVGQVTRAGTNCGSCRSEIAAILSAG